jgi:ankyrin repeat protein
MEQINLQSLSQARLAKRILSWLTLAFQSLTPRALVEALAIEPDTFDLNPLNKRSVTVLAKVCRGLVIVDAENDIVQLAHKTVQEFLLSSGALDLPSMQHEMFMSCITYLSFNCCRQKDHSTVQEIYWRRKNYPLQTYAANHLGDHLNLLPQSDALTERVYSFVTCQPFTGNYLQMQNVIRMSTPSEIKILNISAGMTPLHVAVIIGNAGVVRLVLTRLPELLNKPDSYGVTALQWAVYRGFESVVQALLEAEADTMCDHEESFLNYAARTRCDGIVRLLLQHEISHRPKSSELQAEQERGGDLLLAAMTNNNTLVDEILGKGVDVDVRDSDGGTALQWAAWYDHISIIQKLLDHGADIEAGDLSSGRRALHEAAENGCYDVVKLLLTMGAEPDATDRWGWTPLHRAAFQGGCLVVELLLSHGANIDAKTMHGQTALHLACGNGRVDAIRLLIERGINVENFGLNDFKFMMMISDGRREQVVKALSTLLPGCIKASEGRK